MLNQVLKLHPVHLLTIKTYLYCNISHNTITELEISPSKLLAIAVNKDEHNCR